MTAAQLKLLLDYIDAKFELMLAMVDQGADGYGQTATPARQQVANLRERLLLEVTDYHPARIVPIKGQRYLLTS